MKEHNKILENVAITLIKSGVSFNYVYENDAYSGALLYDLGLEEDFSMHAEGVFRKLKERGVEGVITIDPHTTHMMREVYPKFIDGYDLDVRNYLEILAEKGISGKLRKEVTIHDPCLFARYERIVEQPRRLLESIGVDVREPERCRNMTLCCGGPIESLSPRISREVASLRMEELAKYGKEVVTMCPICNLSLSKVKPDAELRDISHYLVEALR